MKYQNNQTRIITVRVEMRKTKKRSRLEKKKKKQKISHIVIFAIIAKNTGIAKIEIFAMHSSFRYDRKNSL